jgi:hypothetical protein
MNSLSRFAAPFLSAAVLAACGSEPKTEPGDVPSVENEAPAEEEIPESQPLANGTYTWKSGIRMDLKIEKTEPYGTTDDFCGDGSCGVANPDDTRLVMRYTVTVPDDFKGVFRPDMTACPGSLEPANGNTEDALTGVAGEYNRDLDERIRPGATKFGVAEYLIEKAYVDETFFLYSSCGDPDYLEEVTFEGTLPK